MADDVPTIDGLLTAGWFTPADREAVHQSMENFATEFEAARNRLVVRHYWFGPSPDGRQIGIRFDVGGEEYLWLEVDASAMRGMLANLAMAADAAVMRLIENGDLKMAEG